MIFLSEDKISEIKDGCSIVEVISDYISLKKSGVNYKGLCPFHAEKTPSFIVNEEKKIFHCFGCGASGNVFNFLMKFEHLSFPDAVKEAARRAGISLPLRMDEFKSEEKAEGNAELLKINQSASDYFKEILHTSKEGERGRKYLVKRGIDKGIAEEFKLGFAPNRWDGVLTFLSDKGILREDLQRLGLVIPREDRKGFYDRFRNRLIFPIADFKGRVVGFGGRAIEAEEPKYMNSPDSPVYTKGYHVYGLHVSLPSIRKTDQAIIVEGYFDLLSMYQHAIKNVVATLGTALTPHQIKLLKRYTKNLIIIFDSDEAGEKAAMRSLPLFLDEGISPQMVLLPAGFDPDTFAQKDNGEVMRGKLREPLSLLDVFFGQVFTANDAYSIKGKLKIIEAVVPMVSRIRDRTERELYIQRVSQRLGVKEEIIFQKMKREDRSEWSESTGKALELSEARKVEKMMVRLMMYYPQLIPQIQKEAITDDLSTDSCRKLVAIIIDKFASEKGFDPTSLMNDVVEDELRGLLSECLFDEEPLENVAELLRSCMQKIRLHKMGKEIQRLNAMINKAQDEKDEGLLREFLLYKQELVKKRKDLARTAAV
ncbi:MAG TPA: DNA primase [Thermodesulfobacteriota bacterium]|nr:DNA primase [Thermodesulfobacteriota bacterium]